MRTWFSISSLFTLAALSMLAQSATASDTYSTSTGILSISKVAVGDTLYSDVKATIGQVISVGTSATDTYDTYTASTNRLAIPVVVVGSTTYYNVVVTLASVISVGSTCSGITACTTSSTSALYSTPASFESAVGVAYQPGTALTASSTVTNRGYYMISNAATASTTSSYATIGSTYSATTGYTLASATLASTSTYNDYLTKTMQLVTAGDGYYRIDSYLHPNNSIDWGGSTSSPTLKFVNNFGKTSTTGNGFVTFAVTINTTTKVATLQAKNRYTYATTSATVNGSTVYTGTYTQDSVFAGAGYYVNLASGAYALSATSASFYLYTTPLSLGMPSFMNPKSIAFVTNSPAPFLSKVTTASVENTTTGIYSRVNSTYRSQVASVGTNAATKTAATAMLLAIKTAVEANGEKLRYSTDVYTAYRDAALATKLVSDSIADGTPGQNLVPYVYFTNEYATSSTGVKTYHPFMVVVSYGNQASPNGLKDVPHPPGSSGSTYPNATVTRYSNLENYIFMIPMKDYGQVTDVTTNVWPSGGTTTAVTKNLWYDMFSSATTSWIGKNIYTWADSADNGILIDGSVMFPAFNNGLVPSHLAGELSASGCHVGQGGGGPHCHADGYQSGQGLTLYNDTDYVGKTHPPLLGFGYDGIAVFGRYRTTTDSAMLGYGTLDSSFGAHDHDSIGYHYHAHTVTNYTSVDQKGNSTTTEMYPLMKGAYVGSTNSIPFFRTGDSFTTNKYLGGTVQ